MTPAQRQYDLDLASSMLKMAKWIEPRSRKVSDTLMLGAQRIMALASEQTANNSPPPVVTAKKQPASTPSKKR